MFNKLLSYFKKDVTIVGLPITKETATQEFYNFFQNRDVVCISSTDVFVKNFGHDYLKNIGIEIIYTDMWVENGIRLGGFEVAEKIISYIKNMKASKIAYLTPGSPYYFDSVCEKLSKKYKVIDTKSSGELCYDAIHSKLPMKIVDITNTKIKIEFFTGVINVLACVGEGYSQFYDKNEFINKLTNDMEISLVTVGCTTQIQGLKVPELIHIIKNNPVYLNDKTILLCLPN